MRMELGTAARVSLGAALAALALGASATAQQTYGVTDLGTLPGASNSLAADVNDRGEVVGHCVPDGGSPYQVGFIWRDGVMTGLGLLPKGNYSMAAAVNSLGVVVGDGDTGNYRPQSWVTGANGLINIFPNDGGNTHVIGINDAGSICGYYTKSLSGWVSSWKAAIWTPDPKDPRRYRTTVLPLLMGLDPKFKGTAAFPSGFNQAGQAAGYASNEVIGQHACFWNNDAAHSIVDLGTYPGDWSSLAWGMNDLGQVVGESHPPFGSRAVVWDNDDAHTPFELPPLPDDNSSSAIAINNLGEVIGTSFYSTPGTWDATPPRWVVWQAGGVFELQFLLDAAGGAGWTINSVAAINNVGQIVGTGSHNGQVHGFLLTPMVP